MPHKEFPSFMLKWNKKIHLIGYCSIRYFLLSDFLPFESYKLTGVNGHSTSVKLGVSRSWTILPLRLRRKAQVHGVLMARSLSFCGSHSAQTGTVALNADAIKFYALPSQRAFYSQGGIFLRPDDEGCRQFNQRLRRNKKALCVCVDSRWACRAEDSLVREFLPACIYMMERRRRRRTISFMHDLPDNSLAQRRAAARSRERCTYLVTSTFCSMCTRCSAVWVPYLKAYTF